MPRIVGACFRRRQSPGLLIMDGMGQLPSAEPRPLSPMIEQMVARELVKHARRCDAYLDGGTADPLADIEVIRDRILQLWDARRLDRLTSKATVGPARARRL